MIMIRLELRAAALAALGIAADHPRARLLRYNALYLLSPVIEVAAVLSPQFVETSFAHFSNMAALHHWLVKVNRRVATV